ncbi:MAG: penicillin-binding protein activator [Magnetospiraceae bacterium]
MPPFHRLILSFMMCVLLLSGAACTSNRAQQGGPDNNGTEITVTGPNTDVQDPGDFNYTGNAILINGKVRVAVLLPLSGRAAKVGKSILNAAQMALFEFGNTMVELRPYDTRGTEDGAASAALLAVDEQASLVLGPLFSESVLAVTPILQGAGVPAVAFSNNMSVADDGIFVMGFLPSQEVDTVVRFAISRGVDRLAILAPDNDYGNIAVEALSNAAYDQGATLAHVALYDPEAGDPTPVVKELAQRYTRDRAYNGLLLAEGGRRLASVAALLPYYYIDPKRVQIMGTGQWDVPGIGTEPALNGAWFAAPSDATRAAFMERYERTYGEPPARLATLGYDAAALAVVLAGREGGPDYSPEAITDPKGFAGQDGVFRFFYSGGNERGYAIKQVEDRENRVLVPAPTTFDTLGF